MEFYVKSYEEIEKNGEWRRDKLCARGSLSSTSFVPGMKCYCEKGPFQFEKRFNRGTDWFRGIGFTWHKSWLTRKKPAARQYLLEFE